MAAHVVFEVAFLAFPPTQRNGANVAMEIKNNGKMKSKEPQK